MKKEVHIIIILLLATSMLSFAQDIIVKLDKNRIETNVIKIKDSLIFCRGLGSKTDTTFSINKKNIKLIIYKIGSIEYFNESINPVSKSADNVQKKIEIFNSETNKESNVKPNIKSSNLNYNYKGSFELGTGFTAGFLNNNGHSSFQFNTRAIWKTSSKSSVLLGLNANYSNLILLSNSRRYSGQGILQAIIVENETNLFHFNLMAGLGYVDTYPSQYYSSGTFENTYIPMIHIGFGGKYFFKNAENASGIFYEAGLGGPYFFNIGLFFY